MTGKSIDLNCDMGESFGAWTTGADAEIVPHVSSINVACGFHAGDPTTMDRTVKLGKAHGTAIGAHPSLPDLQGFGRRRVHLSPEEIELAVIYQIGALASLARANGASLHHVKAHGDLYNWAATEPEVARAIARAVRRAAPKLVMVCLATSEIMIEAAEAEGLAVAREGFADRVYLADGTLQPRRFPGAIIADPGVAAEQALRIARDGQVQTAEGTMLSLEVDTICLHGDNPAAPRIAPVLRQQLLRAGFEIRAFPAKEER